MDQLNQYRTAMLMIRQYGIDAKAHAMRQVFNRRAVEDYIGEWGWLCVFDAVLDVEASGPERFPTLRHAQE